MSLFKLVVRWYNQQKELNKAYLFSIPTRLVLPTERYLYNLFVSITNMRGDLIKNIKSFKNSAELVYSTGDYTSSTILYFKCLFVVLDIIILQKMGKTPKDHTERFNILKEDFSELYLFLDKHYPTYRQTYSLTVNKLICDEVRKNVERIIKEYKINL